MLCETRHTDVSDQFLTRAYIGRHLIDLFQDRASRIFARSRSTLDGRVPPIYLGAATGQTRVYPGVAEALAALAGRKSTATTKGTPTTRLVLEQFGLLPYFDHVQGTDGFPSKPAPDVILTALAALGAAPEDCLLVGDSAADMEAGQRAGVKTCAVLWGYGKRDELARWNPDYWISDPNELASC